MKKKSEEKETKSKKSSESFKNDLTLHSELMDLKKEVEYLKDENEKAQERLQDLEIHANLLTRLLTTLCVEKFGMRIGVLKRIIKRIESEAIRDSQIHHLESLYQLTFKPEKKKGPKEPPPKQLPSKEDPWDDIS